MADTNWEELRRQLIGFGEQSSRKSYYPELQKKLAELKESELRFRTIFDSVSDAIFIHDAATGAIVDVNRRMCDMYGMTHDEAHRITISDISSNVHPYTMAEARQWLQMAASGQPVMFEWHARHKDGHLFWVEVSMRTATIGSKDRILVSVRDITERKQLEAQLRQSQKMEAIGQLAGGVAHDFNNILMVIEGYCSLLQMDDSLGAEQQHKIAELMAAAEKATHLTRGLLAFSRKQALVMKHENLNDIIRDVQKFLARIIGEDITLNTSCSGAELPIVADRGQIEQVLINLATNARDAMQNGGVFSVRGEMVLLDPSFTDFHKSSVPPGRYALLTVSDTGTGISKEHLERIFEPFFTTKELGKGTGLGMAIIYGIVKQHNGFINVYSEPGQGTIFRIYLPIQETGGKTRGDTVETAPPAGSGETILVAEDDPAVRKLILELLSNYGYEVIVAEDGMDAVEKFKAHQEKIRVILMDMIMPGKSGREAYQDIQRINPAIKVLFSSGYTADFIENRGVSENGIELLMKPVRPAELLRKIRRLLDA